MCLAGEARLGKISHTGSGLRGSHRHWENDKGQVEGSSQTEKTMCFGRHGETACLPRVAMEGAGTWGSSSDLPDSGCSPHWTDRQAPEFYVRLGS